MASLSFKNVITETWTLLSTTEKYSNWHDWPENIEQHEYGYTTNDTMLNVDNMDWKLLSVDQTNRIQIVISVHPVSVLLS